MTPCDAYTKESESHDEAVLDMHGYLAEFCYIGFS